MISHMISDLASYVYEKLLTCADDFFSIESEYFLHKGLVSFVKGQSICTASTPPRSLLIVLKIRGIRLVAGCRDRQP